MTNSYILEDYVPEDEFAAENGVSQRTVARLRKQPDGLAYMEWGGRVWIHIPSARQMLKRRTVQPNPTRRKEVA